MGPETRGGGQAHKRSRSAHTAEVDEPDARKAPRRETTSTARREDLEGTDVRERSDVGAGPSRAAVAAVSAVAAVASGTLPGASGRSKHVATAGESRVMTRARSRSRKREGVLHAAAGPQAGNGGGAEQQQQQPPQPRGDRPPPRSPPWRPDDKDGHLQYELGESLTPRYKILAKLGEGTFGRVLECWDRVEKEYCAVKVIRNIQKYRDAAVIEIDVLEATMRADPEGKRHCVQMKHWFDFRGHICMVFEKLGLSLYDFLRKNHYQPFSIDMVQAFGRQLLEAVSFLHELALIHTDLKPENVLLQDAKYVRMPVSPKSKHTKRVPVSEQIKLIDFGSATFQDQYHSTVVSTRHYRAPEVILGLGWSYPCDLWSVGCILIELLTGDALFQTHENLEHLAMMEAVLGKLPATMIKRCDRHSQKYFRKSHSMPELDWPDGASTRDSVRAVRKMMKLKENVEGVVEGLFAQNFIHLLSGLLTYEPNERMTARDALKHPFFQQRLPTEEPAVREEAAVAAGRAARPGEGRGAGEGAGTDGARVGAKVEPRTGGTMERGTAEPPVHARAHASVSLRSGMGGQFSHSKSKSRDPSRLHSNSLRVSCR